MENNRMTRERRMMERTLKELSKARPAPRLGFVLLLLLYAVTQFATVWASRSQGVLLFRGTQFPIASLRGVFSMLSNFFLIFLVVFYGRAGFWTSVAILAFLLPMMVIQMITRNNYSSLPGISTNLFSLAAIILIYRNDVAVKRYQIRLKEQAVTDRLTGLPNKYAGRELMADLINRGETFTLVAIDLNNFKSINNTMGRDTGNKVLAEIASRWMDAANRGLSGTNDFVTSQGGNEYTIIIRNYHDNEDVIKTIGYYNSILETRMTIDDCDYYMTASYGYVEYPTDARSVDTLLTYAYATMYEVKGSNSNTRILRFSPDILEAEQTLEMERMIREALDNGSIFFCLQPQYDISHRLRGFEALARMKDDEGNLVSPVKFIPVAEKTGLIDKVDRCIFRSAAAFLGDLIRKTGTTATLSVNVSARHMMKNDFLDEVRDILKSSGVPANQIEIEITESIMIDSLEKAVQCIRGLKQMGVKIAIDDFGTGYSSLSYLSNFPADLLKIDKSFIDKMNTSDSSRQYVAAIISIGHIMNFDVISEGVEETEQLDTLRSIGCDYIQGYLWGRPLPPEEAAKLVLNAAG